MREIETGELEMTRNEIIQVVRELVAAPSCCAELKVAGNNYLSSLGTSVERAAAAALIAEAKEDICTVDQVLEFFISPAAEAHFGKEKAQAIAAHARELKARGVKYCDCPACAACGKLIADAALLGC